MRILPVIAPFFAGLILLTGTFPLLANETVWQVTLLDSFPSDRPGDVKFVKAAALDLDSEGNIYIIDRGQHQLTKFSPDGRPIRQIGGFGRGTQQFDDPRDVNAHTTLNVFVADYNNNRVVRFDRRLDFIASLTSQWPEPYDFDRVLSIAVSSQYDLFLLEDGNKRIMKFSRFAEPKESFAGTHETYGQLLEPTQLTLDASQRLFVADPAQKTVAVFDYLGNFITNLYHPDLKQPNGIYWGDDQQLYIADQETSNLLIFSSNLKLVGSVSLKAVAEDIVDVAVRYDKESGSRRLFILEPNRCWVFALKAKSIR